MHYRTDVIYLDQSGDPWLYFISPDGTGRIFFDTWKEAHEQTGLVNIRLI